MTQNGQFVKRGVLTSRDMVESNFQILQKDQPVDIKRETVLIQTTNAPPINASTNIVINKPPLTTEELNSTKYYNSLGVRDARQEFPYNYQQGQTGTNSNFIPPPPSKFMMGSTHQASSGSQHSQLPIQSGHPVPNLPIQLMQNYPPGHPLFQNIRKTFVPHHIYNEIPIPVMSSETKYIQVEDG